MEKIATDAFSFADLRTCGAVYVDKTSIPKMLADAEMRNLSDRRVAEAGTDAEP